MPFSSLKQPEGQFGEKTTLRVVNVTQNDPAQLNVRNGPGQRFESVGRIPWNGVGIVYLGGKALNDEDLWIKVRWGNLAGWVHGDYLSAEH